MARNRGPAFVLNLRVGALVEVRSESDILATLDENASLDGLPFMPEMGQFCGRTFRVYRRAGKVNDMVEKSGLRRMKDAVILEGVRCDGEGHGGCQAGCQILWKESWLRKASPEPSKIRSRPEAPTDVQSGEDLVSEAQTGRCTPKPVVRATRRAADGAPSDERYRCQATEMRQASTYLSRWDIRQYVEDVWSGNVGFLDAVRAMSVRLFNGLQHARGLPGYPVIDGKLTKTPQVVLDLKPGELVEVRTLKEIVQTLDTRQCNRGLWFDAEMVKYCRRRFRVLRRVHQIIDEKTGRMLVLPNECIILEGVTTRGDYHRFYPQNEYQFWREAWLKRVE